MRVPRKPRDKGKQGASETLLAFDALERAAAEFAALRDAGIALSGDEEARKAALIAQLSGRTPQWHNTRDGMTYALAVYREARGKGATAERAYKMTAERIGLSANQRELVRSIIRAARKALRALPQVDAPDDE